MPGSAGLPRPRVRSAGARHGEWGHVFQWYAVSRAARKRLFAGRKGTPAHARAFSRRLWLRRVPNSAAATAAAAIAAVRVQPCTAAAQHARQCMASCAGCGRRRGGRSRSRGARPRNDVRVGRARHRPWNPMASVRVASASAAQAAASSAPRCRAPPPPCPPRRSACVRERGFGVLLVSRKRFDGWVPLG